MRKSCQVLVFLLCGAQAALAWSWRDAGGETHAPRFPLLVVVWSAWCKPCAAELAAVAKWRKAHPDAPLLLLAADAPGAAKAALARTPIAAPLGFADEETLRALGVQALPTTLMLDADGRVVRRVEGRGDWSAHAWEAALARLAPPPEPTAPAPAP